mmetsp:Transcript_13047/g.37013  ORF Transcript_13047/g.37013 Transcript_13047/m.37013 type:complete len:308 (+) Transcript_13047:68-991(+)
MKSALLNVALLVGSMVVVLCAAEFPEGEVKMVVVLTRHGDRTPVRVFPNVKSEWPEGWGQLTGVGMRQHYELGQHYRKKFVEEKAFIPAQWHPHEIFARSTCRDRTLMSAQSFMLGLYPPGTGPVYSNTSDANERSPALPHSLAMFPIHTTGKEYDRILYSYKNCEKLSKMQKNVRKSDVWKAMEKRHRGLLGLLSEKLGKDLSLKEVTAVNMLSRAERIHHRTKTLDEAFWAEHEEEIREVAHWVGVMGEMSCGCGSGAGEAHLVLGVLAGVVAKVCDTGNGAVGGGGAALGNYDTHGKGHPSTRH